MYRTVKRLLDILFSAIGLLLLMPILILLAIIIRIETSGSAIFRQQRVGQHGELFEIFKLRTMKSTAPHDVATADLENPDEHITLVGRLLRKTSLDELPQLVNVLRGEMSLIGPRPLVPSEGSIHEERMVRGAYAVQPGITGWAQVNGRDCVNAGRKAELDAFYAKNLSFWLDLKIVVFSVICVVTARGVREGATEFDDEIDEQRRIHEKDGKRHSSL